MRRWLFLFPNDAQSSSWIVMISEIDHICIEVTMRVRRLVIQLEGNGRIAPRIDAWAQNRGLVGGLAQEIAASVT